MLLPLPSWCILCPRGGSRIPLGPSLLKQPLMVPPQSRPAPIRYRQVCTRAKRYQSSIDTALPVCCYHVSKACWQLCAMCCDHAVTILHLLICLQVCACPCKCQQGARLKGQTAQRMCRVSMSGWKATRQVSAIPPQAADRAFRHCPGRSQVCSTTRHESTTKQLARAGRKCTKALGPV